MSELPEKVIVSSGCHDCPFEGDRAHRFVCLQMPDITIDIYGHNHTRHPQCPLLTHTIKVVKND